MHLTILKKRVPGPKLFMMDYDLSSMYPHILPKKKVVDMTEDEQADEIITRLKTPRKSLDQNLVDFVYAYAYAMGSANYN